MTEDELGLVGPGVRRRTVLRGAVVGGLALAGAAALSGCGGGGAGAAGPTEPTGPPRTGGTLRAAFAGSGAAESLDPAVVQSSLDAARGRMVHGVLGDLDPAAPGGVRLRLLERAEPRGDGTAYRLVVRGDARFSDGSPVTARDVAFSLTAAVDNPANGFASFLADFAIDRLRVVDDRVLELPTANPVADGVRILCLGTNFVVKEGTREFGLTTPTSGPFRAVEFEPGRGAVLVRNEGYGAGDGGPYLDRVEVNQVNDPDARANGLRTEQFDFAHDLSPLGARTVEADSRFAVVDAGPTAAAPFLFQMNMASPPFYDLRVRRAFQLGVDRPAILATALSGRGILGNDLFSVGFPDYPPDLPPRPYDPDRARALLAEAGAGGLTTRLSVGADAPGLVETATLLAEQLSRIGVRVEVDQQPPGGLYTDFDALARMPFLGFAGTALPPLYYYEQSFTAGNPFGFGWNRPDVDGLVEQSRATADPAEARALAARALGTLREEGNVLLPVFKSQVSGRTVTLAGATAGLSPQYPNFAEAWLA